MDIAGGASTVRQALIAGVIDELAAAVLDGAAPLHDGAWGLATLEVCIAMLASARESREVALTRQCAPRVG